MQDIEYNGIRGSDFKIYAKDYAPGAAAQMRMEEIIIPGRDGSVFTTDGSYQPTSIPIQFNFIGKETEWGERWRQAKKWLSARNAKLRLSDDSGYHYRIAYVTVEQAARMSARTVEFAATFIAKDGLQYLDSGLKEYEIAEISWNPYELSKPVYKITGEGVCELRVNGSKMSANVGQNIIIDTERMISYRADGTLQNTAVSGKYEGLYLCEGENEIECIGGKVKIIPNWRCR